MFTTTGACFVDADVKIYPDTLSKIVQIANENQDLGAFFGSYDEVPPAENFFSLWPGETFLSGINRQLSALHGACFVLL